MVKVTWNLLVGIQLSHLYVTFDTKLYDIIVELTNEIRKFKWQYIPTKIYLSASNSKWQRMNEFRKYRMNKLGQWLQECEWAIKGFFDKWQIDKTYSIWNKFVYDCITYLLHQRIWNSEIKFDQNMYPHIIYNVPKMLIFWN